MQRDMELFRKVLFKVEELPFDGGARQIQVEGYDDENTTYHVKLAIDAGFIDAINVSHQTGKAYTLLNQRGMLFRTPILIEETRHST